MKTVSEVSRLSGVSVRTLHHYDRIGLLKPSKVAKNGYRYYDDNALLRLQEILLFRELDFPLKDIKTITASSFYDRQSILSDHIRFLELKRIRLEKIIDYVKHLQKEGNEMTFDVFDDSDYDSYQREAKERWGETAIYREFETKKSSDFSVHLSAMTAIFKTFGHLKHLNPKTQEVREKVIDLQSYITNHFYTCTDDILSGLGQMYVADERFKKNIDGVGGVGTADFVAKAIDVFIVTKTKI